jgi:hypothetical protein
LPSSAHDLWEGRQLVRAAEKYHRIVQHGTQSRSAPGQIEAIDHLRKGTFGDIYLARGLCFKRRDTIGRTPAEAVPPGVKPASATACSFATTRSVTSSTERTEGHISCALVHLANASYRLGRALRFDPDTEQVVGDEEATRLLSDAGRGYRAPFVVPDEV